MSSESPEGRFRSVEEAFVEDCFLLLFRLTISLERLDEPEEFDVDAALLSCASAPLSSMAMSDGGGAHL